METEPHLLRLPSELRIRIYELVLSFARPLKLRQTVPGSENTTILRVNRQICHEALSVLYDINTIALTRNDFCSKTDAALKTPVPSQHIRHLLVTSFSESIACNYVTDRCDVCETSASGFLDALKAMPQLKEVTVDYTNALSNFTRFSESFGNGNLPWTSMGFHTLRDEAFRHVDFTFQYVPIGRMWPALTVLPTWPQIDEIEENKVLAKLREADPDVPDKLWLVIWARKYRVGADFQPWAENPHDCAMARILSQVSMLDDKWAAMEMPGGAYMRGAFVYSLRSCIDVWAAATCRRLLHALRRHLRMQEANLSGSEDVAATASQHDSVDPGERAPEQSVIST
ncbi:hypothetical protein LTR08_001226 [Meristemomyces frigidus]|nr:hypothetical protein LTR08_001226 [Meristemomyces frigidus]